MHGWQCNATGRGYARAMSARLGLDDVDPRTVQLPIGTEVLTRADKQVGGRLVTQGAVGRVVALDAWLRAARKDCW